MSLTNNNLALIKAIASNNVYEAKRFAVASLCEDTSKKNAGVVNYYKKLLASNNGAIMSQLPDNMKTILVGEAPGGFDPDRYYLRDTEKRIIDEIRKMKLVSDEMSARKIPYKNTTLLFGESGTGKTEFGRYIANKLNLPFFYVSFVSTIDSYMGSTAKNIHKVFEFCNSIPCVLMLDEIDCVAAKRSASGGKGVDGEIERTTITLMQELDRLPNHVTLIAATNRLDMVDEAMLRRFSIKHEVINMTAADLDAMIRKYISATDTEKYVSESDISSLASSYDNPGQVMPELIKLIGKGIYEEKKEELAKEDTEDIASNMWEVTYTWKKTIVADTEEDAVAFGRSERQTYRTSGATEEYAASPVWLKK